MNTWNVYVMVYKSFCKELDTSEFHFKDVEVEDTANYLTIYDKNGTLAFRCHINEIAKFVKYK